MVKIVGRSWVECLPSIARPWIKFWYLVLLTPFLREKEKERKHSCRSTFISGVLTLLLFSLSDKTAPELSPVASAS